MRRKQKKIADRIPIQTGDGKFKIYWHGEMILEHPTINNILHGAGHGTYQEISETIYACANRCFLKQVVSLSDTCLL